MRNPSLRICREYQVTFCDGEESVRTMVEEEEAAAGFLVTGADSYEYILKNRSMMSDYQEPFEAALARNYRTASLEQLGIDPRGGGECILRSHAVTDGGPGQGQRSELLVHPIYWYFSCIF